MRHHIPPQARMLAREVRKQHRLPVDGRRALANLTRLEEVYRKALSPDVPSYDVSCIQEVRFDEWLYTEGLGCFIGFTQSVEINARLLLAAGDWTGGQRVDHAAAIRAGLRDKWALAAMEIDRGLKVFFPPGNNIGWIVNTDNVLRAFRLDSCWRLKPHPVTTDEDVHQAKLAFGATRVCDRDTSGMALLRAAGEVGYTVTSEMGLVAMILGKPATDFTRFEFESHGRYHALYYAIRRVGQPAEVLLNRWVNCPWSGIVPLDMPNDEALDRFREYKARTLELRRRYAPLTNHVPRPQGGNQ